jgi:argininosuccinate lyase
MPLWAKDNHAIDDAIVRFCAGDDAHLDPDLLPFDVRASQAHVEGLGNAGILDRNEVEQLVTALGALELSTLMTPDDEDGHSAIERALVAELGDVGKKVHTGRSRNDQVLVAQRLYAKDRLEKIEAHLADIVKVCLARAAETQSLVMPGYTHLQRAVPSTAGFWFAGHAESFLEDLEAVQAARALVDKNPLGTAAGYGVNLDLDREHTTEALGFAEMTLNGLCAQNGRGRMEAHVVSALLMPLGTVRRLSWDLSLFSTSEYALVKIPMRFCTGSSIMPNKRNPDAVEILRARFSEVAACHTQLVHALALPSGYQRDLQVTKGPLFLALNKSLEALALIPALVGEVELDEARCAAAVDAGMLATDDAIERAKAGTPFREAYKEAARAIDELDESELTERARQSVEARVSLGAPGALALDRLEARLARLTQPR